LSSNNTHREQGRTCLPFCQIHDMGIIATLTFSPCIDKITSVAKLIDEKKLYCVDPYSTPGGGGVNVARAIKRLGGKSVAIYPAGGYCGNLLNELMRKEDVSILPIEIQGDTRENLIIKENSTNRHFRFIMPGPALNDTQIIECLNQIESLSDLSFIVVSGSFPEGVPANIFERLAGIADRKKAKLVVDTSGGALKDALMSGVYLIKPNLNELASLVLAFHVTNYSIAATAGELISKGHCNVVVVSMGSGGALLVTKDLTKEFSAPQVEKMSTSGSGDCMVAGIVLGLENGMNMEDAVQYGVVCGSAAAMHHGTALIEPQDAQKLLNDIHLNLPNC